MRPWCVCGAALLLSAPGVGRLSPLCSRALKSAEECDRLQEGLAGRAYPGTGLRTVRELRVRFLVCCFSLGPLVSTSSRCSGEAAGSQVAVESTQKLCAGFPSCGRVVFVPLLYRVINACEHQRVELSLQLSFANVQQLMSPSLEKKLNPG